MDWRTFPARHPRLWVWVAIPIALIGTFNELVQFIQAAWGLFSSEPLAPILSEKLKSMDPPSLSPWSIIPALIGITMLLWLTYALRRTQTTEATPKSRNRELDSLAQPSLSKSTQRISFIDFLREAEKRGLNFLGDNPTILNLCKELRQAASDGTLEIWGRIRRQSDPLILIPAIHWHEFNIDWMQAVVMGPPSGEIKGFADDNFFVGTRTLSHGKAYFDLHVNRARALEIADILPWTNQPDYFIWAAAYLWGNQKPIEGKLGPDSVAYPKLQMIKGWIQSGKIKSSTGGAGANDRVSSEELKKIAFERKEYPKFLFPD